MVRISTRVATSPCQTLYVATSSVLPGLPVCSSPWPRKEFDWNGDVATRVDMPTKVKFFKKYLFEGMSDPGKIIRPGR